MTNYKLIVYCAYTPNIYDVIIEINGEEAWKHYQTIQKATAQQLQSYLYLIASNKYNKRLFELATKCGRVPPMTILLRVMRARTICARPTCTGNCTVFGCCRVAR
jgi:hypothetical protein